MDLFEIWDHLEFRLYEWSLYGNEVKNCSNPRIAAKGQEEQVSSEIKYFYP